MIIIENLYPQSESDSNKISPRNLAAGRNLVQCFVALAQVGTGCDMNLESILAHLKLGGTYCGANSVVQHF